MLLLLQQQLFLFLVIFGSGAKCQKYGNLDANTESAINYWQGIYIGVIILIHVVVLIVVLILYERHRRNSVKKCHLCEIKMPQGVSQRRWHRQTCANQYESLLEALPSPYNIRCGICYGRLKEWPNHRMLHPGKEYPQNWIPHRFLCFGEHCPSMDRHGIYKSKNWNSARRRYEIQLSTGNRFNCFVCDYDLCKDCIAWEEEKLARSGNMGNGIVTVA